MQPIILGTSSSHFFNAHELNAYQLGINKNWREIICQNFRFHLILVHETFHIKIVHIERSSLISKGRLKVNRFETKESSEMADDQKENIAANGNPSPLDHDEFEYLKLIKKIIETG